jgi:manganese/zinc/iron transport system substrate-binding protein
MNQIFSGIFILCTFLIGLYGTGCEKHNDDGKIHIVATTGIIGDILQSSLDSNFVIHVLMKPGVDPHLYKATAGDISLLLNADIIIFNGLHLEGKMSEVLAKLSAKKNVIAMSDHLPEHALRLIDGAHDPHLWFDVQLWHDALQGTLKSIAKYYPAESQSSKVKADEYAGKLQKLHAWTDSLIASIPEQRRYLITAHDAFGYFGDAYDIKVVGLQGMSTLSDFGMNDLMSIGNLILQKEIRSIFVEMSIAPRSMEALMLNVTSRGGSVNIGGNLYADALDASNTNAGTYIGMIKHNVNTIVKALK